MRPRMPDVIRRLAPDRFRAVKIDRNDARTPTLASPGRRGTVEEIRLREIEEELVATIRRQKP